MVLISCISFNIFAQETNKIESVDQAIIQILTGVNRASSEIYDASKIGATKTLEILKLEGPDIVNSYIKYSILKEGFNLFFPLIFSFFCIYFSHKIYKCRIDWDEFLQPFCFVILVGASVFFFFTGISSTFDFLHVLVSPKTYLIKEAIEIMKSAKR